MKKGGENIKENKMRGMRRCDFFVMNNFSEKEKKKRMKRKKSRLAKYDLSLTTCYSTYVLR
jgi:hypothetical protein